MKHAPSAKIEDPKPTPPAPMKAPDMVSTLIGWRGWEARDGKLYALGSDYMWPAKRAERSFCRVSNHQAPEFDCACGFWAFRTLDLLIRALEQYVEEVVVVGPVELWGRVIECDNGFRAEYAYPKELWILENGWNLDSLSWIYGVPVKKYVPVTAMVKEGPKKLMRQPYQMKGITAP